MAQTGVSVVKLMQLNAWMGRLTRQLLPVIEREQPDILTMQEVFSSAHPTPLPDNMFDLYERVQAIGYAHSFFSPICSFQAGSQTVQFGNALFSKYPILSQETFFTSGSFQPDCSTPDFQINARNAQIVKLSTGEKTLHVINHHGYWESDPSGSDATVLAMRTLTDHARKLTTPLIFAGDLNVNPNTPAMGLFDGWLEDLTKTYDITDTLSPLGKVRDVACDHILTSTDVHVRSLRTLDEIVSDHKALLLEFEF